MPFASTDGRMGPGGPGASGHVAACMVLQVESQNKVGISTDFPSIPVTGPWAMPRPVAIEGQLWTCSMVQPQRLT